MIKYILFAFFLLCLILLLFNLIENKNISNNFEFKYNSKNKKTSLEKDVPTIKNELKLIENEVDLNCSLKGTNITNGNNQQIILIMKLIILN